MPKLFFSGSFCTLKKGKPINKYDKERMETLSSKAFYILDLLSHLDYNRAFQKVFNMVRLAFIWYFARNKTK